MNAAQCGAARERAVPRAKLASCERVARSGALALALVLPLLCVVTDRLAADVAEAHALEVLKATGVTDAPAQLGVSVSNRHTSPSGCVVSFVQAKYCTRSRQQEAMQATHLAAKLSRSSASVASSGALSRMSAKLFMLSWRTSHAIASTSAIAATDPRPIARSFDTIAAAPACRRRRELRVRVERRGAQRAPCAAFSKCWSTLT